MYDFDAHPPTIAEARALQTALGQKRDLTDRFGPLKTVAGIDVGYSPARGLSRAAIVLLNIETLAPIAEAVAERETGFPYVPGLLSFRELPVALQALDRLGAVPDLVLVDGQGIAHPRRLGIAAHFGLVTDLPAIGVAKSRLIGTHTDPGPEKGDRVPLMDRAEQIGIVLRSRKGVKPLYISPGHRVAMATAAELTMRCLGRYRLPEPTRLADRLSKFKS